MSSGEISRRLAEFAVRTRFGDIPVAIVEKTKRHILDTLGAGIAGALSDEVAKLAEVFAVAESGGNVPLWATGRSAGPRNAALANGMACHTFELDDTGGCDHSGAVVVPAALATLQLCARPISGEEFITATVIGYDIARRALEACGAYEAHNGAGWHSTSTCGTFGAAAAAGHLLRLDVEAMQSALGLAASSSGGLWAFIHDGAQSKRLHPGRAAEGGLLAALLAREGFAGPHRIFDDVWGGFTNTFAPQSADPAAWLAGLGENWKMGRVSIKPHASCRGTHSSVDAIDGLFAEHKLTAADVERIEVRLSSFLDGMCGGRETATLPAAQMSLPYALAARLVYGTAGLAAYRADRRTSSEIAAALDRIVLNVDDTMQADEEPVVGILSSDGRVMVKRVEVPLGSPANPVPDDALFDKYRNLGLMVWPETVVDDLAQKVSALEKLADMSEIEQLLATPPVSTTMFS